MLTALIRHRRKAAIVVLLLVMAAAIGAANQIAARGHTRQGFTCVYHPDAWKVARDRHPRWTADRLWDAGHECHPQPWHYG